MIGLFSRRVLLLHPVSNKTTGLLQFFRYFATKDLILPLLDAPKQERKEANGPFTVPYLIDPWGLPSQVATSISKKVLLRNPKRRDLVLSLLRDYGFNGTQICKIVRYCPKLLVTDVEKYLLPKFQFFLSLGASKAELRNVFSSNPKILRGSLKNKIIPYYHILRDVVCLDDRSIVRAMKRSFWFSLVRYREHLTTNISLLRNLRVPQSSVSLLASCNLGVLVHRAENFGAYVKRTVELGFNPSTVKFIKALVAFGCLRPSTWVRKFEAFGKLGWSEDEICSAFKKQPILMTLSVKKVTSVMQFLVNEMGMDPSTIAKAPIILFYSLKKRVMPRGSVIKVLQMNGLIEQDVNFATVLGCKEKCFMIRYVNRYQSLVPNLGKIYAAEMDKL